MKITFFLNKKKKKMGIRKKCSMVLFDGRSFPSLNRFTSFKVGHRLALSYNKNEKYIFFKTKLVGFRKKC